MHFFAGMAVFSYSLVYVTFSSLMKHERVRTFVLISRFSTKISAFDFRLFLKMFTVIAGLLFQKPIWLLTYFYKVAEVNNFGRIYTSLVSQRESRRLLMKQRQDVYIRQWLFEYMYIGCEQGTATAYIYVLGTQRVNQVRIQEGGTRGTGPS